MLIGPQTAKFQERDCDPVLHPTGIRLVADCGVDGAGNHFQRRVGNYAEHPVGRLRQYIASPEGVPERDTRLWIVTADEPALEAFTVSLRIIAVVVEIRERLRNQLRGEIEGRIALTEVRKAEIEAEQAARGGDFAATSALYAELQALEERLERDVERWAELAEFA